MGAKFLACTSLKKPRGQLDRMDSFIESVSDLLEASPSCTVSITYSNTAKKSKREGTPKATNVVKFKVHDTTLNKSIKYSTNKGKDVSRFLTYLGPRGLTQKRSAEEASEPAKKQKLSVGAASIMSNTPFEEPEQPEVVELEAAGTPAPEEVVPASTSSKKKKKKGKKK